MVRYVLYVRVMGNHGGDYERIIEDKYVVVPRAEEFLTFGVGKKTQRAKIAAVHHSIGRCPIVTASLYGRLDGTPWQPHLEEMGFEAARPATITAVTGGTTGGT